MRDLVETVIDNLLRQEQMQRTTAKPKPQAQREAMPKNPLVAGVGGTQISPTTTGKRDEKLWQACCQFEAIFLQQMMSAMRKGMPKSDLLGGGFANNVQNSMMDQAIAEAGAKQGNLGIAASLYRQLEPMQAHGPEQQPAPTAQGKPPPADNAKKEA